MLKKGSRLSSSADSGDVPPSTAASARVCSARTRSRYAGVASAPMIWLTTRWLTATPWSTSAESSRAHSATARRDGMPTMTKSVTSGSVSSRCSSATRSRHRPRRSAAASSCARARCGGR
eukprot:2675091-Prymnesium_polylepis.1